MDMRVACLLLRANFLKWVTLAVMLFWMATLPVSAEVQTITAAGEYTMGEGETLPVAKERALAEAVQAAAEQAGIYVESYSRTSNLVLTKDEVSVLARGMVEVLDKRYDEPRYSGNTCHLRVTVTARVDTGNIEALRRALQDRSSSTDLKRLQAAYEDCQQEINRLKAQLARASGKEKQDIVKKIAENERRYRIARLIEQGYHSAIQKNYQAAVQAFTQAIDLDPRYAFAYTNRATAYLEWQQTDLALADFKKAIALDQTDDSAYYNRGVLYGQLRRYDLALADYTRAIALNPRNVYAYNNRGIIYADAKQYDLAMADYNKALAIDSGIANIYDNRGNAYFELGQYQQALADCNQSIALAPDNKQAYHNRGQMKTALNQYEPAIADFNQAILLGLNTTHVYRSRGMAYFQLKQYQTALTDYDQAIQLDPGNTVNYYYRGLARFNLRQFEAAIADYDKTIALAPGRLTGAYFYKGLSLGYLQRPQEAIASFRLYIRYGNEPDRIEAAKNFIRLLGGTP